MTRSLGLARGVAFVLVFSAVLATPTGAHAGWLAPEQRLTTHPSMQWQPDISYAKVVFSDYRNSHDVGDPHDPTTLFDIAVLDLETGTTKILTPQHTAVSRGVISGNYVAWEDYGTSTRAGGIYLHDLKSGVSRRLPIKSGRELSISGRRLAYEAFRNGHWDIYVFDFFSNTERRLTTNVANPGAPQISGTRVVWQDFRHGNHDIYLYDLASGDEKRVTTDTASQTIPSISGSKIVWIDERNGALNDDIYLYDAATGMESQITTDPGQQWFPSISGNKIVWQDDRNGSFDVYLYDLVTKTEHRVTPVAGLNGWPAISGRRIVHDSIRDGNQDVYLTELALPSLYVRPPAYCAYGERVPVRGMLIDREGAPVPGRPVTLQISADGTTWKSLESTVTSSSGAYSFLSPVLTRARHFRTLFAGDAEYPGNVSAPSTVKPRLHFTAPRLSTSITRFYAGRTYLAWGYFRPAHATGSKEIKIRAYRKERQSDGTLRYVYKKTFVTTVSNPDGLTYSRFAGHVAFPSAGSWRLKAFHAEDASNSRTYSASLDVTVR